MPNPLQIQSYVDDFQIIAETLLAPVTGTALIYAERDIVIDAIYMGVSVVGTSSATLQVVKTTTGTLTTPASASAAVIAAGTALHTAQAITALGTFVPTLTTPSLDTNLVKAGNWVGVVVTGTVSSAAVAVQLRVRSRVA
jgi:hypothetical protein